MKTLLVICACQSFTGILDKILSRTGYTVVSAANIADAKNLFDQSPPDGVILCNDLPDGMGIDFCLEARKNTSIPIMLISNDKDDELLALNYGASDFMKMPFDFEIFKTRLAVMLNLESKHLMIAEDAVRPIGDNFPDHTEDDSLLSLLALANSVQETQGKRTRVAFQKAATVLVACVLLVLIGLGAVFLLNNNTTYINLEDPGIPLAEFPSRVETVMVCEVCNRQI